MTAIVGIRGRCPQESIILVGIRLARHPATGQLATLLVYATLRDHAHSPSGAKALNRKPNKDKRGEKGGRAGRMCLKG